jgi:hypothetical protein
MWTCWVRIWRRSLRRSRLRGREGNKLNDRLYVFERYVSYEIYVKIWNQNFSFIRWWPIWSHERSVSWHAATWPSIPIFVSILSDVFPILWQSSLSLPQTATLRLPLQLPGWPGLVRILSILFARARAIRSILSFTILSVWFSIELSIPPFKTICLPLFGIRAVRRFFIFLVRDVLIIFLIIPT